ncbi:MAG: NAD(P)/FAD-dependent oxidoreductase [Kofleriaceae bacterium]|nr:NAD(P)/FAD-dependent oxidoreductase [Kofleriaceae bacterium]
MTRRVDLVIVGGGPAGLSTALHLQTVAPGLKVVVLEKATYPREKICAGGVGGRAFRILEKLGIEIDCPKVAIDNLAIKLETETVVTHAPGLMVVVRRVEFDHALAKQVRARGIELLDGTAVERIELDEETGVRVTTDTGQVFEARALVGADGVSGVVRRQAGFAQSNLRAQVVELDTEGVAQDHPRDTILFDLGIGDLHGYAWDFPTIVDGKPLVCRGAYVIRNLGRDDARGRLATYLADRGLRIEDYRIKQFAERGWEPGAEISAPRVLLVGEAAGIDIATGEGIGQAIEYGAVAGAYLARAFERDRLRFSDWHHVVHRHHLGFQLRIRHACYEWFFSAKRPSIERMIPQLSAGLQLARGLPRCPTLEARDAPRERSVHLGVHAREAAQRDVGFPRPDRVARDGRKQLS